MNDPQEFAGRVALVTGGSRGIGRATACQLASGGARVAINYAHDDAAANGTLACLAGEGHMVIKADIADPYEVQRMINTVASEMSGLDILINNAGSFEVDHILKVSYEEWLATWDRTLAINLRSAANASFCAVPHMRKRGGGRIVNVSSRGAFRGDPDYLGYVAGKAAMKAMAQSMAIALAPEKIAVATVAPGWVDTDMAAPFLAGDSVEAANAQSPLNRIARPEEIAHAIVFLASQQAEFATGCVIDVNGASYLRP